MTGGAKTEALLKEAWELTDPCSETSGRNSLAIDLLGC